MSVDARPVIGERRTVGRATSTIFLNALMVGLYGLITALLLSPFLTGQRTFFGCCDASVQSIAWLTKVADAARAGHLSLWDFNTFSGSTFAGELQPAPLYPVTLALSLTGWRELALANAFIGVHILISLVGMHFFLATNGLRRSACVIGATLFTFCGFVFQQAPGQVNIYAGLVMLPMIAGFFQRSLSSESSVSRLSNLCCASVFSTAQIYAGHLTPYIYTMYGIAIFTIISAISEWRSAFRIIGSFFAFSALSISMAAVPLTLSYEYLKVSYRWFQGGVSTFPHEVTLQSWREASPLVGADLGTFIHAGQAFQTYNATFYITLVGLCLLPVLVFARSRLLVWCILLVAFSIAIEASSISVVTAAITHHLPLLAQTRIPARSFLLYAFAASTLVALALNEIESQLSRIHVGFASTLATGIVALCVYELYCQAPSTGMPIGHRQEAERYYHADPAVDALAKVNGTGPLVDRFIALPTDLVPPNIGDTRPLLNVFGHRGTMYIPFFDFVQRDWDFAHSKSFDELGARWVISETPRTDMSLVEQGPGFFLYERPVALSTFWTDDDGVKARAPVTDVEWSSDYVQLKLAPTERSRRLVFAQASYPGWTVSVEGKKVPLLNDDIFLAVSIPAGSTDVRFSYSPDLVGPIAVTLAAIFGVLLGFVFARQSDRRLKALASIPLNASADH